MLLLDENLSEVLCNLLNDIFPETQHIRKVGLQGMSDAAIWDFALANKFAIVSKDSDFMDRAIIVEQEIKVIWIRLGNCSTANVHLLIRNMKSEIDDFLASADIVLELP